MLRPIIASTLILMILMIFIPNIASADTISCSSFECTTSSCFHKDAYGNSNSFAFTARPGISDWDTLEEKIVTTREKWSKNTNNYWLEYKETGDGYYTIHKTAKGYYILMAKTYHDKWLMETSAYAVSPESAKSLYNSLESCTLAAAQKAALAVAQAQSQSQQPDPWQEILKTCNRTQTLNLTVDEFILYLEKVEEKNPTMTPQQLIAAIHANAYPHDLDREEGIWPITFRLFQNGPETDGYRKTDLICKYVPKFVIRDGEKIDIAHAFAGMRSDLNRDTFIHKLTFGASVSTLRKINTRWGDYWQVLLSLGDWNYAPPDQLKGDDIGVDMAEYYLDEKSNSRNPKLSDAFRDYFRSL